MTVRTTKTSEAPPDTATARRDARRTSALLAAAIVALAVALRVAYVLLLREHPRFDAPSMDAGYHLAWAEAFARGEEFQDGPFFRAPLYPLFLGLLVRVFGEGTLGPRLVQAALGGATVLLTYRLAARLSASTLAAALAASLAAFSWVLVAFDAELLIPALLVPLLLAALERLQAWDLADVPRRAALVGFLFGLAAVARPNVLLFMPVLFVWTAVANRGLRTALALTAGTLVPILPVTLHNASEGDATLVATQAGVNLWIGNNPASDGTTAIVPGTRDGWWEGYYDAIALAEEAEGRALRPTEVSSHYARRAVAWMADEPAAALVHQGHKLRLLLADAELSNNQDPRFTACRTLPLLCALPIRWSVLLGLGLVGAVLAIRRREPGARLLAAFALVYAASIVLFFVTARFRVPLVPVLAVFSGVALTECVHALRARDVRRAVSVLVPAGLVAAASLVASPARGDREAVGLADLGRAELARDNPVSGLRLLEEAYGRAPGNPQIAADFAAELSRVAREHGRALGILDAARSAARGTPFGQDLDGIRIDVLLDAERAAEALAAAEALLARGSADGRVRLAKGRAEAALGRTDDALRTFEALARDEPQNAAPWVFTGRLAAALGDAARARAAFERVLELERFAPPVLVAEARAALAR